MVLRLSVNINVFVGSVFFLFCNNKECVLFCFKNIGYIDRQAMISTYTGPLNMDFFLLHLVV